MLQRSIFYFYISEIIHAPIALVDKFLGLSARTPFPITFPTTSYPGFCLDMEICNNSDCCMAKKVFPIIALPFGLSMMFVAGQTT